MQRKNVSKHTKSLIFTFKMLTFPIGPKLTLVFLLRHLNEQDPRVKELLTQLTDVDPKRTAFYRSLQSKLIK